MKRLIVLAYLLALFGTHLSARLGPDKILARSGGHVFTQSDMNLYHQILGFMIGQALDPSEQQEIQEEVISTFKEYPRQIEAECWALKETLALLESKPGLARETEIRNTLFETLIEYEQKGNESAFIEISRRYKPEKFLPRK